ncbi:hypothetical protein Bpfe_028861 [Biomphalaria pfeifferi]|uniref:Uncharacterized protein n=1 Tax=Biomphalaria pfeifferi TaxID=112525 RepID=A0AAD8EVB7_BIOPF|nr:hypothetical protein Bpfe_028861 [Biomphalaria pfeifferi]
MFPTPATSQHSASVNDSTPATSQHAASVNGSTHATSQHDASVNVVRWGGKGGGERTTRRLCQCFQPLPPLNTPPLSMAPPLPPLNTLPLSMFLTPATSQHAPLSTAPPLPPLNTPPLSMFPTPATSQHVASVNGYNPVHLLTLCLSQCFHPCHLSTR